MLVKFARKDSKSGAPREERNNKSVGSPQILAVLHCCEFDRSPVGLLLFLYSIVVCLILSPILRGLRCLSVIAVRQREFGGKCIINKKTNFDLRLVARMVLGINVATNREMTKKLSKDTVIRCCARKIHFGSIQEIMILKVIQSIASHNFLVITS